MAYDDIPPVQPEFPEDDPIDLSIGEESEREENRKHELARAVNNLVNNPDLIIDSDLVDFILKESGLTTQEVEDLLALLKGKLPETCPYGSDPKAISMYLKKLKNCLTNTIIRLKGNLSQ